MFSSCMYGFLLDSPVFPTRFTHLSLCKCMGVVTGCVPLSHAVFLR